MAAGRGFLALKILEAAQRSQVPFYKHKELAEALFAVPLGCEIPPELYELTAQVLAFVLRLEQKKSGGKGSEGDG